MTGLTDCGDIRHALGVYVVGAIDPAERSVVDAHLSRCLECREELAGLAGLPALLGRVPLADAERMALGDEVPDLSFILPRAADAALFVQEARRHGSRGRIGDRHRPGRGGIRLEPSGMRVTSASLPALS